MFTEALCTTAQREKHPKRPPLDEWINKMRPSYTMEYYSALKREEMLAPATRMSRAMRTLSQMK